jgi:hypothetical protein
MDEVDKTGELIRKINCVKFEHSPLSTETYEKTVESIQYYRKLDFFTEFKDLSDAELLSAIELFAWMNDDGSLVLFLESFLQCSPSKLEDLKIEFQDDPDLIEKILRSLARISGIAHYDLGRLLHIHFDSIYSASYPDDYLSETRVRMMHKISKISRGIFLPQDLVINERGLLRFKLNGRDCEVEFEGEAYLLAIDPWIAAKVVNPLIADSGYQFELIPQYPEGSLILLTEVERTKLEVESGWKFERE